jgi:hypothetical protein
MIHDKIPNIVNGKRAGRMHGLLTVLILTVHWCKLYQLSHHLISPLYRYLHISFESPQSMSTRILHYLHLQPNTRGCDGRLCMADDDEKILHVFQKPSTTGTPTHSVHSSWHFFHTRLFHGLLTLSFGFKHLRPLSDIQETRDKQRMPSCPGH